MVHEKRLPGLPRTFLAVIALLTGMATPSLSASDTPVVRLSEPVESTDAFETFGIPLPEVAQSLPLPDVLDDAAAYVDADIQVTAKVKQVCQKKGCFLVAQAGPHVVRVSFKDYGFFVPTDISGRTVTLHGVLTREVLTAAQARHFSEDAQQEGAFKPGWQYEFVAVSVRVPRG